MVKLMVLALVVALPAITYSAPPADPEEWVKEKEKEDIETFAKMLKALTEEKEWDAENYVCCNSPPRIPDHRKKTGRALKLRKRAGIGYGAVRRAFDEFPRRNAFADLPQDDSYDSIDTLRGYPAAEASSSRLNTLALVKRLMKIANRQSLDSGPLRDDLSMVGLEEPVLLNYPGKRGGFVADDHKKLNVKHKGHKTDEQNGIRKTTKG